MQKQPKVLLATTCRWFSAARLGIAFARAGCAVEAVSPTRHPIELTTAVTKSYRFDALSPSVSLKAAIDQSQPDIVVPCDDLAAMHLRRMWGAAAGKDSAAGKELMALLERSMGEPSSYLILASRGRFLELVRQLGINAPATEAVNSPAEVRAWCRSNGLPAVLKADGTSGGTGVKMARTEKQAVAAFQSLHAPVAPPVAIKRALVDRDLNLLAPCVKRRRNDVTIQGFVPGVDFNIAVACWQGEVISSVGAEVLQTWRPNGPASVIRLVPDGEMLEVAKTIARRLQLSGLFGLDFLVDKATGEYTLLEINPRATQTCHIPLGEGHDLAGALYSAISGQERAPVSITAQEEIALFPLAWQSSSSQDFLDSAFHDIPWEAPQLVRAGKDETRLLTHTRWMQLWIRALQR